MEQTDVIDCKQLSLDESKVENTGTTMEQCVVAMEKWAANPSEMDYWIPTTSWCDTIDAVAKWTFPDKPFVTENLEVCYIALIHDKDKIYEFQLDPVQITKREILDNVPLYVAHFEEGKEMAGRQ
ncbi:hypothetical protein V7S43_010554 [Phytophthora oleae]|uniref:Uncharacterized protein n=1 Tax=Phytophthora oleae TaxID=2107226 RepID=A0ABD3FFD4_9STRA